MDPKENIHEELYDAFAQEVWDYAQQRYNVGAAQLNCIEDEIIQAFMAGKEPMDFVDEAVRGWKEWE